MHKKLKVLFNLLFYFFSFNIFKMPAKRKNSPSESESKSESKSPSESPDKKKQKNIIFENMSDIKDWLQNPLIHPDNNKNLSLLSNDYTNLYNEAFDFLEKYFKENYDLNTKKNQYQYINLINQYLPKNHVLFKLLDSEINNNNKTNIINYGIDILFYYNLLKIISKYSLSIIEDNIITKNIYLYNNIISNNIIMIDNDIKKAELNLLEKIHTNINLDILIKSKDTYIYNFIYSILNIGYIPELKSYLDITFNDYFTYCNNFNNVLSKLFIEYIYFLENFNITYTDFENENIRVSIGTYILSMIEDEKEYQTNEYKLNELWIDNAYKIYDEYVIIKFDVASLINKDERFAIDNLENKQFNIIEDPINKYFKKYDNIFENIKKEYYDLIDMTTLHRIDNLYLTEEQFDTFIKQKEKLQQEFDNKKKMYSKKMIKYNKIKGIDNLSPEKSPEKSPDKSPEKSPEKPIPPMKPSIKLPNGATYNLGAMNPKFIPKKRLDDFNTEYKKIEKDITEYNNIKNLSYIDLINKDKSPSSKKSANDELYKDNKLLKQTREEIQSNILNNTTQDKNKCSENIDIITQEEFDDTYPLAKLQLIVQIKRTKDITDCYYAPDLYNSFVKSVNNKLPFQHPITKKTYNSDDINKLMEIMKIIDPNIEIPKFLKPINDTELNFKYILETYDNTINNNLFSQINFYRILITRKFGGSDFIIYNLCCIPSDIEHNSGDYQTHSTDLTSAAMVNNIVTLFNNGLLLSNYVPPYSKLIDIGGEQYKQIINLGIHFNNYTLPEQWLIDTHNGQLRTKQEFIDMFKHYAQEIKNYM